MYKLLYLTSDYHLSIIKLLIQLLLFSIIGYFLIKKFNVKYNLISKSLILGIMLASLGAMVSSCTIATPVERDPNLKITKLMTTNHFIYNQHHQHNLDADPYEIVYKNKSNKIVKKASDNQHFIKINKITTKPKKDTLEVFALSNIQNLRPINKHGMAYPTEKQFKKNKLNGINEYKKHEAFTYSGRGNSLSHIYVVTHYQYLK